MNKNTLKLNFFILISLLPVNSLLAQSKLIEKVEASSNALVIPCEKWKLSNGLTLIIHEDHSDPIVNVRVAYHVGSARETAGKSGFAHFFEHMMFEGSDHVADKEFFKIISEAGGDMNGSTERDRTTYYETIPSNYLESALWLESDRMGFLLDAVTKQRFENQRETVKNEKGQNTENVPYGLVEEVKDQALYPPGHPYSWPTIGYTDDLNRVTVNDLKSFFLRWYGPNNAILVIAGDVNSKEVLTLVEKYFGSIIPCPEVKKVKMQAPVLSTDIYANYIDNIYSPLVQMAYPTVPAFHHDEPALDMLASMMGESKNSVFYKNFDKTEKATAGVHHFASELSGEFTVEVVSYPDFEDFNPQDIPDDKDKRERWMHELNHKRFNEAEQLIHQTIDEFEKTGINDSLLLVAKAKKESDIISGITTVYGKTELLSYWQMLLDRPFNLQDEMDRYDKVTTEDISRVFNKYIKNKHSAIVEVYPKDYDANDSVKSYNPNAHIELVAEPQYDTLKYVKAKDNFDRSKRPVPGPAKTPVVPQYYTHVLKNGIKIIGTQTTETPLVYILLTIEGGQFVEGNYKKRGISALTASVMNEGTQNYTTEQISAQLDMLGSSIEFGLMEEYTLVRIKCLEKNIDPTLKILEEKLLRPGFREADFNRAKKQLLENFSANKKSLQFVAAWMSANLIFGNTFVGSYPTDKTIKKIALDDVKNYYSQNYSPSVANLVVVGNVSEDDILKKLEFLNQWQGKEVKMPEAINYPESQPTQIYLANKEGATQSYLMIGNVGMPYDVTGDFFKANAMNFCLGRNFNSRLNLNVRENKGYTYGIYSYFTGTKYPGIFTIQASVKRSVTDSCIAEIMKELENYKTTGLKDEEVAFTKKSLLNSESINYESPEQKATFLHQIVEFNLPKDFPSLQAKVIKDLSKNDLNALANKYINPDKMVILIVGNSYLIKNKLQRLGYKIKDVTFD